MNASTLYKHHQDLVASVASMDAKVHELNQRIKVIDFHLVVGDKYEPDALTRERGQLEATIASISGVLESERARLEGVSADLQGAERLVALHHPQHVCQDIRGHHTYKVTSKHTSGPHRGVWRTRECTVCGTTEKMGR